MNLKYILTKLNFFLVNNVFSDTLKKEKDEDINDFVEIYNMVFNFQHFCLLPNNDEEENEKKAEEMQNSIYLDRSNVLNMDMLSEIQKEISFNDYMKNIPMSQSIILKIIIKI